MNLWSGEESTASPQWSKKGTGWQRHSRKFSSLMHVVAILIEAAENDGLISGFPDGEANEISGPAQLVKMGAVDINNE